MSDKIPLKIMKKNKLLIRANNKRIIIIKNISFSIFLIIGLLQTIIINIYQFSCKFRYKSRQNQSKIFHIINQNRRITSNSTASNILIIFKKLHQMYSFLMYPFNNPQILQSIRIP